MSPKKPALHERHVTVSRNCIPSGSGYVEVPAIRIAGRYLEKRGFTIGSKVTISEYENLIIIKLAEQAPDYLGTSAERNIRRKMDQLDEFSDRARKQKVPYGEKSIDQYLRQDMPSNVREIVEKFSKGQLPESFNPSIGILLDDNISRERKEILADVLLNHLGKFNYQKQIGVAAPEEKDTTPAKAAPEPETSQAPASQVVNISKSVPLDQLQSQKCRNPERA